MKAKRVKLSDQLRNAIENSGKSRYLICKETGIGEATMSRFMHGTGGLSVDSLDRIADCLGLNITAKKPCRKKGE